MRGGLQVWLAIGIALPLLLFPTFARTQEAKNPSTAESRHPIDRAEDACIEKNPSTGGTVQCIAQAETAWDREMNTQYAKIRAKLNARQKEQLKASQTAWLKYRDAETLTQRGLYGAMDGSMFRPMATASHREMVKQRALLLIRYAETMSDAGL